mgnify:CR=1 FL=1|tara:strand:+ start:1191 stop:1892 length:702 start_codon:yes stop_codon:yes gene_type:complete
MNNLLIIPARGGSKRIPRKNIKKFKGKPILERTIKKIINFKFFKKIIVSTDDKEIASIAIKAGAEIPFMRSEKLSGDFTPTRDVVLHAINWYESRGEEFNNICCLYPTSVLLENGDLEKAFEKLSESNINKYVFAATKYSHPIQRAFYLDDKNNAKIFSKNEFFKRTQDLEAAYHDAGQFYLASRDTWKNKINIFDDANPVIIPSWRAIDIDTPEDWKLAELIYDVIFNFISN